MATSETFTLSLHDALPICNCGRNGLFDFMRQRSRQLSHGGHPADACQVRLGLAQSLALLFRALFCMFALTAFRLQRLIGPLDRKSTRLNSSHANISYAVFC